MSTEALVRRAFEAFADDVAVPPPLTLRGGCAVDDYERPEPFDPSADEPTDGYFEAFAFWGLAYLDAQSWRHYLTRLIDYALRRPEDPAMVADALVRSLRPPDRYPPRLTSLSDGQESVVASFLDLVARDEAPDWATTPGKRSRSGGDPRPGTGPHRRRFSRRARLLRASPARILAENGRDLVTLTVRAWPRDDVAGDVARIVESFEVTPA